MKNIVLCILLLFCTLDAVSQTKSNVVGMIYSSVDSSFVDDAHVCLIQNEEVKFDVAVADNCAFLRDVIHGEYTIEVDALGYELYRDTVTVSSFKTIDVYLKPQSAISLEELTVEGNRNDVITRTAYGQVFYLSERARKLKNPFYALMEVPVLEVNPSLSSVKTLDGKTPLILINGNRVNSGINPLDPSEIESVELITDPPARYVNEGVTAIINIKVKKKETPYIWYELATRHDIPLYNGFGVGYFEIGNPKYSLYGRAAIEYKYNQDYARTTLRESTDYSQHYNSNLRGNDRGWLGELLFKANPSANDYFAIQGYMNSNHTKYRGNGQGFVNDVPYAFDSRHRTQSLVATAGAYYKHNFGNKRVFEARLAYNYNKNSISTDRSDRYDYDTESIDEELFAQQMRNKRHSGHLQLDFNHDYDHYGSYGFGAHTSMTFDRLHQVSDPESIYRNRNISQYVYAQWGTKLWEKLWVTPSVGVNAMWLMQGDFNKNYFLPRITMGLTWQLNEQHTLSLNYMLTNDAPDIRQLNPINTSLDPLYKIVGNPRLKPQTMHYLPLSYSFSRKKWYAYAQVYYKRINNMLSSETYVQDDGVVVSTFGNAEYMTQILTSAGVSYRLKNGRIGLSAGWYANHFSNQTHNQRNSFFIQPSFNLTVKKFLFMLNLYYQTKEVNQMSYEKFYKPWMATFQINYNITENFWVGVCMQNFTGTYRVRDVTETAGFREIRDSKHKFLSPRPFLIIRYSFRKNAKRKINLDKVLESSEEGIHL